MRCRGGSDRHYVCPITFLMHGLPIFCSFSSPEDKDLRRVRKEPLVTIEFRQEAKRYASTLRDLRRKIHQFPELGNHLPRTQRRVLEALEGLPLEITKGEGLTSIVAILRGGRPGPTVLLRADMDGLPVQEQTGLDFASTNANMHACGHDMHMAGLVGAAMLLSAHQAELPGTVVFMFQPGEEGPGGAKPMLDEGLLDAAGSRVDAAFALHVFPGESGVLIAKPGPALAGASELRVTFHGKGGHGSQPETALDPVAPLVEFCQALQVMVTRRWSVFDPVVASITTLKAGKAINVIPPKASMGATVRTLSARTTEEFPRFAKELAETTAAGFGCTAEVSWTVHYPPTINDVGEARFVLDTLRQPFDASKVHEAEHPLMGSEDFSYVLNEVPGAFILLQCSPEGVDLETAAVNHSPAVLFDDAVLPDQAAALATIAFAYNSKNS